MTDKPLFDIQTKWNILAIPLALLVVVIPITLLAIYYSPEYTIEHIYASLITFGVVSIILIIGFIAVRIQSHGVVSQ